MLIADCIRLTQMRW